MSSAWTHTMAYDDVRAMLGVARDGMSIAAWRTEIESSARLLASDRRARQVRIALAILRPQGTVLRDDGFLGDVAAADSSAARDLIYARYLASVPLAIHIAHALFHPALLRGEREVPRDALKRELIARLLAAESIPDSPAGLLAPSGMAKLVGSQTADLSPSGTPPPVSPFNPGEPVD